MTLPAAYPVEYYRVLGLPPTASLPDIKSQHKRLVRIFHPDRFMDAGDKAYGEQQLKEINFAYQALIERYQQGLPALSEAELRLYEQTVAAKSEQRQRAQPSAPQRRSGLGNKLLIAIAFFVLGFSAGKGIDIRHFLPKSLLPNILQATSQVTPISAAESGQATDSGSTAERIQARLQIARQALASYVPDLNVQEVLPATIEIKFFPANTSPPIHEIPTALPIQPITQVESIVPQTEAVATANTATADIAAISLIATTNTEIAPPSPPTPPTRSPTALPPVERLLMLSVPMTYNVNARTSTSTASPIVGTLEAGSAVFAIGRTIDNTWVLIQLSTGQKAWAFVQSLQVDARLIAELPVVE